jgi:glycine hydroxymethyltransferase
MDVNLIDPEIARLIEQEQRRQEEVIELIASENYASEAVLQAQGSVLTNKYAEGYPGKRYYGGCQYVDGVEQLAIDRAKTLFQADYANVQPHSGSQANAAALMALLNPGDCLLGMDLAHGGHLTHGSGVNFSGKLYRAYTYGVDLKTHLIDYQQLSDQAKKYQPKVIIAGFSAYSRVLDWQKFREIADEVGAYLMADIAHVAGLIATGLYPSPIPWADVVTSTTHKTLRGPRGGLILARANLAKKINSAVFPGSQGGPLMHVIAAKAVCFKEALQPEFKSYQQSVIHHAKTMAKIVCERGYEVLTGGTDNHLFLISLMNKQCTGASAEKNLEQANITVNKNMIPNDPQSPMITSGLRIGTPAVTTRGIKTEQIETLTHHICDILDDPHPDRIEKVKQWVLQVCRAFPVYSDRV